MLENGLRGLSCDGDEYSTMCDWETVSKLQDWSLLRTQGLVHATPQQKLLHRWKKTYLSLPAKRTYTLSTNATSGSGRIPDVFTTPLASSVHKHRPTWVYRWRDWVLLTGLLCLEKLQSIKFDLYRWTCWQRVWRLFDISSVFIRVNGETKATFMSEWVMQCLSKDFHQCYVVNYVLFLNFNWNI